MIGVVASARAGPRSIPPAEGSVWPRLDRYAWAFAAVSGAMIVAGGMVAASNSSAQLSLWNLGNAVVVVGVLGDLVGVVVAGSVMVLGALGGFAVDGGPTRRDGRGRVITYRIVILGLAGSVVIGAILAQASPGTER